MTRSAPVIAIDGPAASGKGTLAIALAEALRWHRLDSGMLYRVVTYVLHDLCVDIDDSAGISSVLNRLRIDVGGRSAHSTDAIVLDINIDSVVQERIGYNDLDITEEIRTDHISELASHIAALPGVRSFLLPVQQDFRQAPGLVADGRDMGTVVFPDAEVKIYLHASREIRILRRQQQLAARGEKFPAESSSEAITARDDRDHDRKLSPLKKADDAIVLDSSDISVEEMTACALGIVDRVIGQ